MDISAQDRPAPKVTVNVEGIEDSVGTKSVSSLGLSEAAKLNLPTATAGSSKGNVSDEARKLKLKTDNWTTQQFLELLKYTKDITLALCYTLAAPVNLEFPNSRYFGPTIAPDFRGPTADVVKLWRLTKNASCVLTGANVLNSLIELFSFFTGCRAFKSTTICVNSALIASDTGFSFHLDHATLVTPEN